MMSISTFGKALPPNAPKHGAISMLQILGLCLWAGLWLFALTICACLLLAWTTGDRLLLVRLTRYLLPWVLLCLLLGLLPALFFQRVWLALALVVPALAIGLCYLPLFLPKSAPPSGEPKLLKVMSFNVWSENQSLLSAVKLIRQKAPDILLLQEVLPDRLRELTLALEQSLSETDGKWHVAYAPGLMQAVISPYPVVQQMANRNIAKMQKVQVDTPAGAVTVFNVHPLRGDWKARHQQLITLLQEYVLTTPGPTILGGDFNTTDQSQTYKMLSRHLRNAHWEAGRGFGFTYPAYLHAWSELLPAWPLVRIDHIFYNRNFYAVSAETLKESCGSDHFPVTASLALIKPREK